MCYWEENIRKQIEIAFLLTDFFRILLNKLPLCSASSYSWTSSRKSNLELIKKSATPVTRLLFPVLDRGCSADRPQPVFESSKDILFFKTDKYTYISSNISNSQQKGLNSWVHHQEQFFLSMFKAWKKIFRLSTIWQIFGIFSARKRENFMHIWKCEMPR